MSPNCNTPEFTHVSLRSGTNGFIVQESDDTVVVQDQTGQLQEYDKFSLHLVWARKDWSSAP